MKEGMTRSERVSGWRIEPVNGEPSRLAAAEGICLVIYDGFRFYEGSRLTAEMYSSNMKSGIPMAADDVWNVGWVCRGDAGPASPKAVFSGGVF